MRALILHHYWLSPYADKVRRMLGAKGLAWRSVEAPVIPPRPSLSPVLGAFAACRSFRSAQTTSATAT